MRIVRLRKTCAGRCRPRGVLFEDELVYAGHAYRSAEQVSAYRGCLVAEPKRYAAGLGDLTDREAGALRRLVTRLARALKEVTGPEHVYSFVLGDGLAHLHVVLAPRYVGTSREHWGVPLREWPDAPRVGEDKMRSLVVRLRTHMSADWRGAPFAGSVSTAAEPENGATDQVFETST